MSLKERDRHLDPSRIQDYLERQLPPEEEAAARRHLSTCPACREEVEVWRSLFLRLESLPIIEPSPTFADRVLERIPRRRRVLPGILEHLPPLWRRRHAGADHLTPAGIQAYLDGLLSPRRAARLRAHVEGCTPCRNELALWEELVGALSTLPHHEPSPAFEERVMARVRVPSPAPTRERAWSPAEVLGRLGAWTRGFLPATRRAWAVASGVAFAPTITVGALAYLVFSHPALTLSGLLHFLEWKVAEALAGLGQLILGSLVESTMVFRIMDLAGSLATAPALLGGSAAVLGILTVGSVWVLYRNVFPPTNPDRGHAQTPR